MQSAGSRSDSLVDLTEFSSASASRPDGGRVVTGYSDEHAVRVWRRGNDRRQIGRRLHGDAGWVNGLVFSPNGSRIPATCSDGTVRVWDVARVASRLDSRGRPHHLGERHSVQP